MVSLKWLPVSVLWLLQSCAISSPMPGAKNWSYGLTYLGSNQTVSMQSIVTGETSTEKDPTSQPRTPLARLQRANITLTLSATEHLTCLPKLQTTFTAASLADIMMPEFMSASFQGQYNLELVLMPPANFDFNQTTRLNTPTLQFFAPFDCQSTTALQDVMTGVLSLALHEVAHLESFQRWPGGWKLQLWLGLWLTTDAQISILATEIVASQFQNCAAFLAPATNSVALSISIPTQRQEADIHAAIIQQELSPQSSKTKSDGRTAIGAMFARLHLRELLGERYNAQIPAQKQTLEQYCQLVLTPQNIQRQINLLEPYRQLL